MTACAVGRKEASRRDAVDLMLADDRPIRQIAEQLGFSHETLRSWVRDARRAGDPKLLIDLRAPCR
ncbi:helix-turn-helix domain-containing protein [Lentzea sp. NBC_00516]|uniref:helix-turn-helix domain-containing protein n=1 Tax=Lentzea sp. NBC_00516 TaxID=2903582 RepID=UPI003FA565D3